MSDPIAVSDDLALFMGQPVDDDRAELILGLAQDACEEFVSPLPTTARRIVLSVAARVYTNPTSVTTEALGPYSASRPDIFLTRQERVSLWRIAGRGGAGSASVLEPGANAVQSITVAATAGTFTLILGNQTTAAIAYNASAATVQTAIAALGNVGAGNVTVSGAYVVTFVNNLGNTPIPTLVADASALTGTVAVAVVATGVPAAGASLAPWDYDAPAPVSGF